MTAVLAGIERGGINDFKSAFRGCAAYRFVKLRTVDDGACNAGRGDGVPCAEACAFLLYDAADFLIQLSVEAVGNITALSGE